MYARETGYIICSGSGYPYIGHVSTVVYKKPDTSTKQLEFVVLKNYKIE